MAGQSALSPQSWSSTHVDFKSLRFVVWTGGDPGFTLTTARPSESGTYSVDFDEDAELRVDTVTAPKVWEAGIRPGDILETVSGKRVHTMDSEAALVLVRMSKSPSIIRFRSPTSGTRKRFDIVLRGQKLGVFFTGDGRHEIPVVTRIGSRSSSQDSDRDAASSFFEARLGDVLVAVNGKDAIAAGLHMTSEYLETCPRPLKFTFERITNNERFDHQATSEESVEHRQAYPTLHQTISSAAVSALAARETASLRCKAFLKTLMPKNVPSPLSPVNRGTGHRSRNFGIGRDNVVIEWNRGPLGLTLLEDAISGVPIVNRLTGKGLSANMERLQHGFQLYSINGVQVKACSLKDLYRDLLALPKPVALVFCPPLSNGTSDESSESQCSASSLSSSTVPDISGPNEIELSQDDHQALAPVSAAQHRCPEQSIHDKKEYEVTCRPIMIKSRRRRTRLVTCLPDVDTQSSTKFSGSPHLVCRVTLSDTCSCRSITGAPSG
uniref:PDZ domain-containing protein n=1 Tax=Hyaloperonospora arabidopsidis (strain Emoy2) TaxID=559515 RepID=M4BMS4_HYAAE